MEKLISNCPLSAPLRCEERLIRRERGEPTSPSYRAKLTQLFADHLGSIVGIVDAGGNALAVNSYDEYGIPASTNQGRFQYSTDKVTGLFS